MSSPQLTVESLSELGIEFEPFKRKYRSRYTVTYRGIVIGHFGMITKKLNPRHFFPTHFYPREFRTSSDVLQFLHGEKMWVDDRIWQTKNLLGFRS